MDTYTTRNEAIQAEIIDPIQGTGVVTDAHAQYNVEAIADQVLDTYDGRLTVKRQEEL